MDLGAFAEEVLDAVAGICGDTVVESHEQASHVLEALCRRPGANQRELAAVFGLTLEQFARSREHKERCEAGREQELREKDPVWANLCLSDAIYTWNALIERINHAAHWREEFREMVLTVENGEEASDEESEPCSPATEAASGVATAIRSVLGGSDEAPAGDVKMTTLGSQTAPAMLASEETRAKARQMVARHLEPAPDTMRLRLAQRLDDELFEFCPDDKEYRHAARSLVANLRRNQMLAAGYATGRVPPQWLVLAEYEALAPRLLQLTRRLVRVECAKQAKHDDESARLRQKMSDAGKGTYAAPPASEGRGGRDEQEQH